MQPKIMPQMMPLMWSLMFLSATFIMISMNSNNVLYTLHFDKMTDNKLFRTYSPNIILLFN